MSNQISPLNRAHQHDQNAEDYRSRGLLVLAAEEHYKAAEALHECIQESMDENTKRTLRKLYSDHCKAGKDLQKTVESIRGEGKDPNLPQLPAPSSSASRTSRVSGSANIGTLRYLSRPQMRESPSNTVDESFMLLTQQVEHGDDPFELFWKVTEEMMENLSQPLAFPAAALTAFEKYESNIPATSKSTLLSKASHPPSKVQINSSTKVIEKGTNLNKSSRDKEVVSDDEDYDSSDSFLLVASIPGKFSKSSSSSTLLLEENANLKRQLETLQAQFSSAQRQMVLRKEQDHQLRDHIMVARKEAQRVMATSTSMARPAHSILEIGGLALKDSPILAQLPGLGRDRESQFLKRIRELEDEVMTLRAENERQKGLIVKFRERWDRLKESAKRKKDAKANAHFEKTAVAESIEEDPEAEAAAEAQNEI